MSKKIVLFLFLPLIAQIPSPALENIKEMMKGFWKVFILGGIAFCFFAFLIGGVKLITSAGESSKISEGKSWIIGGATGLVILLSVGIIYKGITGQTYLPWEKITPIKEPVTPIEVTSAGIYFCVKEPCKTKVVKGKILPDIEKGAWVIYPFSIPDVKNSFLGKVVPPFQFVIVHQEEAKYAVKVYSQPYYKGLLSWGPFDKPGYFKVGAAAESFLIYRKGKWHGGEIILWRADVEGSGYHIIKAPKNGENYRCFALFELKYKGEMNPEAKKICPGPLNWFSPIPCLGALEIHGNYLVELQGKEKKLVPTPTPPLVKKMLFPKEYRERKPLPSDWENSHTFIICVYPIKSIY